jgi:hypothetical protein
VDIPALLTASTRHPVALGRESSLEGMTVRMPQSAFTSRKRSADDAPGATAGIHVRQVTIMCAIFNAAERPSKKWSHKTIRIISPAGRDQGGLQCLVN